MNRISRWLNKNEINIFLLAVVFSLVGGMVGMIGGLTLILVNFHNLDLSVNMLLVAKEFNLDWWAMEDVSHVNIVNGTENYTSMTYPAIYTNSWNILLYVGIPILLASSFVFAWGVAGATFLIGRVRWKCK